MTVQVERSEGGVRFAVYAQPRASRTEVAGVRGEAVKIRVAAPPVDGEANDELVAFLAKTLGVSKSGVRIVQGERGRNKMIEVIGATDDAIRALVDPDNG